MIVVPASTSKRLAERIAKLGGYTRTRVTKKAFPDGELYVRIHDALKGQEVLVIASTTSSESIIELQLLLGAAREADIKSLVCLIPYFGYARQHKIYNEGEALSSKVMTKAFENFADSLLTVDIHDEQTLGYSKKPFHNIKTEKPISDHFAGKKIDVVLSPDDGSAARAKKVAELLGAEGSYIDKTRIDSNTVEMRLPDIELRGKKVLIVDDMISSGGTLVKAIKLLTDAGVGKVYACAVHGLFANGSGSKIDALVDELAVTDTVESKFSKISVAGEVVKFLKHRSALHGKI